MNYQIPRCRLIQEQAAEYPTPLSKPESAIEFIRTQVLGETRECLIAIYLNTKNEPLTWSLVSVGTIDRCNVGIRDIIAPALFQAASGIMIAHNHPSGWPAPSEEDRHMTKSVVQAAKLFSIRIVDHIIIGSNGRYYSFAKEESWTLDAIA